MKIPTLSYGKWYDDNWCICGRQFENEMALNGHQHGCKNRPAFLVTPTSKLKRRDAEE
jgi:hypothetical protein